MGVERLKVHPVGVAGKRGGPVKGEVFVGVEGEIGRELLCGGDLCDEVVDLVDGHGFRLVTEESQDECFVGMVPFAGGRK